MNAVITADIIDSTKLTKENEDIVLQAIHQLVEDQKSTRTNLNSNLSIRRGDNIQIELEDAKEALKAALLLKTALNKITFIGDNKTKPSIDVRIAIGTGAVHGHRDNVNESTGEAYTNSGRTLDAMKKYKRTLAIKTGINKLDAELETEFKLLEVIMSGWKVTSAEVMYWTLQGLNEIEIGQNLGKTQSAINQRKKTAGWSGIEPLLERFQILMDRGE